MGKILGTYIMPHPPIIIPEVGRGEETKITDTISACTKVADEISSLKPNTIIIVTPHGPVFRDAVAISYGAYISGNLKEFKAPNIDFNLEIDIKLTEAILKQAFNEGIPMAKITENSVREYRLPFELDHGTMVPLYFINQKYTNYKIVHITYGAIKKTELYQFGIAIRRAVEETDSNAVFIASGDLSHRLSHDGPYEFSKFGKVYDETITDYLVKGDTYSIFDMDRNVVESAGECGMRSFYIMLGTLEGYDFHSDLLSYEGPFGVGYGVLRVNSEKNDRRMFLDNLIEARKSELLLRRKSEDIHVTLARESLEHYIKNGTYIPMPSYVTKEMQHEKRGVFVSLKIEGELRGCIGTTTPTTDSVAEEIIRNSVEAGEHDPRFFPVDEDELDDLEYSVDVLMPSEECTKDDLDPKVYGVIVKNGHRSGLLLPDLEGVDTVEEQISIALEKAGIDEQEDYALERFTVVRYR